VKYETKRFLLRAARLEIAGILKLDWKNYRDCGQECENPHDDGLAENKGTFVTLTINCSLRGCIGQITPSEPVLETVRENAASSAFRDPRFPPLSADEFYDADLEISILSMPEKLAYSGKDDLLSRVRQGDHGVIIRSGFRSATFLPQVWEELPSADEFFSHLCMKAGLSPDEWKRGRLEVHTYTVEHFNESGLGLKV
jgi:AmmeMemoRadiSam system protein A